MKVAHSPEPAEEQVVFRDGLGVRERRELPGGEVVEWFHLAAEFSAAEALLRERVARLAKFQHVKFSRILGLEPSGKGRGPILVSNHLGGTRLAEVLEMAGHGLVTFDTGAGLHVTREVLGGLAVLHDSRTVSHGTLAPERVVLTPNGRVVMVEHVLGPAIDRLQRPRHQLWREWRIPTPPSNGQVKLDIQADLAQAGLLAIAVLLGRPVDEEEYPHRLRGLLPLIQDRLARSPAAAIAGDVVAWLERLAPLDSRRAFTSAREAQQAYESLVANGATAMGASSSRVKGVIAAVSALAAAPASAVAAREVVPAVEPAAVVVTPEPAASATDEAIDIEALLRLEAELEGGSAPAPDPVAAAVRATQAAPPAASSLEALEQERRDLQQQFASLVEAVAPTAAPTADPGPVHLIPETPLTSEPLVDERVRWSSMPAADLTDIPAMLEPEAQATTPDHGDVSDLVMIADEATADVTDSLAVFESQALAADHADVSAAAAIVDEAATDEPVTNEAFASVEPEPAPVAEEAAAIEPVNESPLPIDGIPFRVEPIVIIAPEEPAPAAAIDHVPADWWKEALPWRDEDHAAPVGSVAMGPVVPTEPVVADEPEAAEIVLEEPALEPTMLEVMAAPEEAVPSDGNADAEGPAAVGESFGYLTLDAIEARASRIGAVGIDDDPLVEQAEEPVTPNPEEAAVVVDASLPLAVVGDEPASLAFSADLLHDEPVEAEDVPLLQVADEVNIPAEVAGVDDLDASPYADAIAEEPTLALPGAVAPEPEPEPEVEAEAEPEVEVEAIIEPSSEYVPEPFFEPPVDQEPAPAFIFASEPEPEPEAAAEPEAEAEFDPYAQPSSSGLFGDLRPIMLQDLEPASYAVAADEPLPLADAAPLDVASSLFTRADAAPQETDWRDALLGAGNATDAEAGNVVEPAALEVEDEALPVTFAASAAALVTDEVLAEEPVHDVAPAVLDVAEAPVDDAPALIDDEPALIVEVVAPEDEAQVPEVVVVDEGADRHAWEQLASEAPAVSTPEAPAEAPWDAVAESTPEPSSETVADPGTEDLFGVSAEPVAEVVPDSAGETVIDAVSEVAAEVPANVAVDVPTDSAHEGLAVTDDAHDEERDAPASAAEEQAVSGVGRKKRRRSRRKKAAAAPAVEATPVVAVPAPAVVPAVEVPVQPAPMAIAPVLPPDERDPAAEKAQLHSVSAARPTSLLEREVPQWTPPADLGALRPRVVQPTASEMAVPAPPREPAVAPPEVAARAGGDEWGTGSFLATAMASGETIVPSRPAPQPTPVTHVPTAMPAPVPVAPVLEIGGSSEAFRGYEPEIRAVGLPDPDDLDPRGARATLTTAADAIGTATSSTRTSSSDPRVMPPLTSDAAPRGINWRRLMAAAALIALFNGAAVAAWWWVQPGARGTLVVETGRSGVEVLVDGAVMGQTPFRGDVKPGRHTLRLRQGSIVRDMPVEISDGVVTTQTIDWLPGGGGRGALQVSSNPSGAELFVGGKSRGKTPLLLEDLPEGDLPLMIRSEAGTVTTTATVVAGETTPVEVKVFAGWVLVDSEYEVDLSLNGKKIGASMDGQILLPPGPYRLRAENRSLGIDQPLTFTVEPGAVTRLSVKVSAAYYDAPEGTEVIIDGTSVGTGPGRIAITPGTHDVVVRQADGSEKHFSGVVRANRAFEP